jgi:prepilin peptidase CpaA
LGVVGGGDAKLLAAVGSFLGVRELPGAMLLMGAVGGVLAAGYAVRKRIALPVLWTTGRMIRHYLAFGRGTLERPQPVSAGVGTLPYGIAIGAGAVIWHLFGGYLW